MAKYDFLRAECAMAANNREKHILVSVPELQSALHRLSALETEMENPAKPFGYAISREMRMICSGDATFIKIKRSKSGRHDCQVFFREIPTADGVDILKAE